MGQNKDFPRKSGLKTAFLRDKNSDQLTLGGSETHIFEGIAKFSMCFEKFGTLSSKWAMGKASIFDSVRLAATWNFFERDTKKCKKRDFFAFCQITWEFDIETHIQGTTMWKLTSRAFRKCGSFWASEFLNVSYRCSKLAHCRNFGSVTKNKRRYKKKTRPQ